MIDSITVRPEPHEWGGLIAAHLREPEFTLFDAPISEWRRRTREELFGRDARLAIATGHQAEVWHPGILAKYLALESAGDLLGSDLLVELVVDQDTNDPTLIRVPVIERERDRLGARETPLAASGASSARADVPTGAAAPIDTAVGERTSQLGPSVLNSVNAGLAAIADALNSERGAATRATQFVAATIRLREHFQLLEDAHRERQIIAASAFARTTLWRALLTRLVEDEQRAIAAYNEAAESKPDSGIAPLGAIEGEREAPLWRIDSGGVRRRATIADVKRALESAGGVHSLWPRAALTTGFLRIAAVDLMIHGLGGEVYDEVTERWLAAWLGARLAPRTIVSATVRLDFGRPLATEGDRARARWESHHLRHNLDRLSGEENANARKRALLREMREAPRRSPERARLFRALHELREQLVARRREEIDKTDKRLASIEQALGDAAIIGDRTWAFPLYPRESLVELRDEIRARFARGRTRPESSRLLPATCGRAAGACG